MNQKQSLWNKDFILICLTSLFMFTSFYFLISTLPMYVTEVLKGSESNVGYIVGVLTITAVLVRPISGYLLDTMGRKSVVVVALVAFVAVTFAYNLATSLLILFLLRAIHGLSWGFTSTGAGTIASDIVPAARRGEGMGYYGLAGTLAMALGPVLSLYILDKYGFNTLFTTGSIIAALALLCVLGIKGFESNIDKKKTKISLNSFLEPRVYSLSVVLFFVNLTYGGIVSFITLYAKELNIANAGIFFMVYGVSLLFVRPYAGKVFDKRGPNQIMFIGFLALAISFLVLFLAKGYLMFILSAIILGIGFGIVQPTLQAMAINRVEPFRRGAANGTIFTALDLGIGIGSISLGLVSNTLGLSYMYLICAFVVIIPMLVFFWKDAKKPSTQMG
ncbi:MFS transporter [Desulforamulus aeronauticus]|uniref:Predicted arabinose efflux permease, MFS family n=1 Tax=Desulforamulus aeronauticus DSM 10349 TaxID=1121421 RepID=A0A1M6Q309_9FIRM|nr:MFS transporter [Desulforamulus aeronauticus]SHK14614.1 Predicted arabinose efflux permease, MFS family [Desulforamulus aeronauticus DSM 10349]